MIDWTLLTIIALLTVGAAIWAAMSKKGAWLVKGILVLGAIALVVFLYYRFLPVSWRNIAPVVGIALAALIALLWAKMRGSGNWIFPTIASMALVAVLILFWRSTSAPAPAPATAPATPADPAAPGTIPGNAVTIGQTIVFDGDEPSVTVVADNPAVLKLVKLEAVFTSAIAVTRDPDKGTLTFPGRALDLRRSDGGDGDVLIIYGEGNFLTGATVVVLVPKGIKILIE